MKWCSGCKSDKLLTSFSKNKVRKDGFANWCKSCMRGIYTSQRYLANRTAYRDRNIEHSLIIECRARARKRGLEFNLDDVDIVIPEYCPVLGIKIQRTRAKITDNTPSIDRVKMSRGYVRGNVRVISWKANRLKSDCDEPEIFEAIARYIRDCCA